MLALRAHEAKVSTINSVLTVYTHHTAHILCIYNLKIKKKKKHRNKNSSPSCAPGHWWLISCSERNRTANTSLASAFSSKHFERKSKFLIWSTNCPPAFRSWCVLLLWLSVLLFYQHFQLHGTKLLLAQAHTVQATCCTTVHGEIDKNTSVHKKRINEIIFSAFPVWNSQLTKTIYHSKLLHWSGQCPLTSANNQPIFSSQLLIYGDLRLEDATQLECNFWI